MIKVVCKCGKELTETGGLLLSPPDADGRVIKTHLCRECYANFPPTKPEKYAVKDGLCTKCGKQPAEWDFDDDSFCQVCFEDYCSLEYYKVFGW